MFRTLVAVALAIGPIASSALPAARVINPLRFGAKGGSADDTAADQKAIDYAASSGAILDFLHLPQHVSTLRFPSNIHARNANLTALASPVDIQPVLIDGQSTPVSNVLLEDFSVNGNRVNQTNLATSGGDGNRHCFAILGRARHIVLVNPTATYCATDGFFLSQGRAVSSSDSDYQQIDVRIINATSEWNGRWGGSSASQEQLYVSGRFMFNGLSLAGYPAAPYSSGGNARTSNGVLGGHTYGGPWDQEDEGEVGGGFNGETFDITDGTCNAGGLSVLSDVAPRASGFVLRKNLTISGRFDTKVRPFYFPIQISQEGSYQGSLKTFQQVMLNGISTSVNSTYVNGVDGLAVTGNARLADPGKAPVLLTNVANASVRVGAWSAGQFQQDCPLRP